MCGIIACVMNTRGSVAEILTKGLKRLEYRGYDSVGIATMDEGGKLWNRNPTIEKKQKRSNKKAQKTP